MSKRHLAECRARIASSFRILSSVSGDMFNVIQNIDSCYPEFVPPDLRGIESKLREAHTLIIQAGVLADMDNEARKEGEPSC